MKRLTIAITYHNEPYDIMRGLLESIDMQIGINFNDIEILIVNDTQHPNNLDLIPYKNITSIVHYLKSNIHNNIGMSRQYAIDHCSGQYIMFCDCDDMLSDVLVLYEITNRLSSNKDVYSFDFLQEYISQGEFRYMQKGTNTTWCFAKVYKVDFVKKNAIEFRKDIRYHEDTYFNHLLIFYKPTQEHIDMAGYIWKYNPASITRANNHEYSYKSLSEYVDSIDHCLTEFKNRGIHDKQTMDEIDHLKFSVIGDMYNKVQIYKEEHDEDVKILERRLASFIKKNDPDLQCCSYLARPAVNDGISQYQSRYNLPRESFYSFIYRIIKEGDHDN